MYCIYQVFIYAIYICNVATDQLNFAADYNSRNE